MNSKQVAGSETSHLPDAGPGQCTHCRKQTAVLSPVERLNDDGAWTEVHQLCDTCFGNYLGDGVFMDRQVSDGG